MLPLNDCFSFLALFIACCSFCCMGALFVRWLFGDYELIDRDEILWQVISVGALAVAAITLHLLAQSF